MVLYAHKTKQLIRFLVFDHRSPRQCWWEHRVKNDEVRSDVLSANSRSLNEVIAQVQWLGHALRIHAHCLSIHAFLDVLDRAGRKDAAVRA